MEIKVKALDGAENKSVQEVEKELLRSEEHTSELQSRLHLVCRLLLEKKKTKTNHEHNKIRELRRTDTTRFHK